MTLIDQVGLALLPLPFVLGCICYGVRRRRKRAAPPSNARQPSAVLQRGRRCAGWWFKITRVISKRLKNKLKLLVTFYQAPSRPSTLASAYNEPLTRRSPPRQIATNVGETYFIVFPPSVETTLTVRAPVTSPVISCRP